MEPENNTNSVKLIKSEFGKINHNNRSSENQKYNPESDAHLFSTHPYSPLAFQRICKQIVRKVPTQILYGPN